MFKKPFKTNSKNQLSGKDKKELKLSLLSSMSPTSVEAFFANNQKLISEKVSDPKLIIYTNEEQDPMLVYLPNREKYVPTLYLIAQYPDILPVIQLKEGVEVYIFKGADLMCPGVEKFPEGGKEDQIVTVVTASGVPVATGISDQVGNEGIACNIIHSMGDKLWEFGSRMLSGLKFQEPKAQMCQSQVQVIGNLDESQSTQPQDIQTVEVKDQNLENAMLNAIKLHKLKQQLPIMTTTFFSKYVKNASPVPLDIKGSSHKKMMTFFQRMAEKGYLTLVKRKENKGFAWAVGSLDLSNPAVKQHKPTVALVIKPQKQEFKLQKFKLQCDFKLLTTYTLKPQVFWLQNYTNQPKPETHQYQQDQLNFLVTKFLSANKIKKYTKMVQEKRKGKTVKVKRDFVDIEYLKHPQLQPVLYKNIGAHLNTFKLQTQLNQAIDEPVLNEVISLQLDEFRNKIFVYTTKKEQLVGQDASPTPGVSNQTMPRIVVQCYKSHNKNVTTIANLEPFLTTQFKPYEQLQQLTRYLQKRYACGSVIRQTAGDKNQVYIQGNLIQQIVEFITEDQGIDSSMVRVVNKLPKKKKR